MGRFVLTESCVIKCAHGGVVQHPSTDSIRTIGGLKPNFCVDILGAAISGCPLTSPCTKVDVISSAMTEPNVVGASGTYALDVSGCQTDRGSALVVESRANTNSKTAKKAGVNNSVEGEEATEQEQREAKKKEQKEQYRLYLLRESKNTSLKKVYKPLRPSRSFADIQTFYGTMDTNFLIRRKIVPFTLAFVYIQLTDGTIDEYRIISKGSLYGDTFKDITYKDESNVERAYIPLNDGEAIKLYYSNVQLKKDQTARSDALSQLTPLEFDPTDAKTTEDACFLKDANAINSNEITTKTFKLQKEYDPLKAYESKVKQAQAEGKSTDFKLYPLDVVATLKDPFGEAEDLLNIYEWAYKTSFSKNDLHLKDLKKKNAYTYAISEQIDYFYVDPDEQTHYDTNLKKLQDIYTKFIHEIVKGKMSHLFFKGLGEVVTFDEIIDPVYDTATEYLNEVRFIYKPFFEEFLIKPEFKIFYENLHCSCISSTYIATAKAKKLNAHTTQQLQKHASEINPRQPLNYGYLIAEDEKYTPYKSSAAEMLGLLVFALFFSKKYENEARATGLYEDAKEFFYTLKNSHPLPAIGDENRKDVQTLINTQEKGYAKVCAKKNKLLQQFESIDNTNQQLSFDQKKARSPKNYFNNLYIPQNFTQFYENKNINPKEFLTDVRSIITGNDLLKQQLKFYNEIKEFDSQTHQRETLNTLMGIVYTLSENKSRLDSEANIASPFNNESEFLRESIKHIALNRLDIQDTNFALEVFNLPITEHYTDVLHAHLSHALLEQGTNNQDGFKTRQTNAQALLDNDAFKKYINTSEVVFDLSNIHQLFFEKTQEQEDKLKTILEKVKAVDGVNSNLITLVEQKGELHSKSVLDDDMFEGGEASDSKLKGFKDTKFIKNYITISTHLSTLVLLSSVAKGVVDWKKLNGADIYSLMLDSAEFVKTTSELVVKSSETITARVQSLVSANKLKKIANLKILARAGFIGIILSSAYDVAKLDKDDVDGKLLTGAKALLTIGLLMLPIAGEFVAAGIIALEIAWALYAKNFIDTPLEAYLMRSLLFNMQEEAPKTYGLKKAINYFSSDKLHPYEAKLFLEQFHKKAANTIDGFDSFEEIQNFIGVHYDAHAELFDSALEYELTTLKSVVYGYNVEILDTVEIKRAKDTFTQSNLKFKTKIKLPKEMLQNNISVHFKIDGAYRSIYESKVTPKYQTPPMPEDLVFDTVEPQTMNEHLMKIVEKKGAHLLVINKEIALHYKIEYKEKVEFSPGLLANMDQELSIKEINLDLLEKDERELIEKVTKARKEKEQNV
ncbi:hypothetical protein [Sulfurimonas sp.]|uniref:hypothetical protein n=1 Tax=Sulfurimonas sp. TaxID=2022749 RepID=UPI003D10CA64